jgi:transcriptional regulator with XRE-family HTH domain
MEFPYRLEKMIMERIELNRARLTECRERLGLSKREAAKRMNMSQPAYLRYESGERTPSIHVVQTMADVLSTSVDYLLGNNDDDSPDSFIIRYSDDPILFEIIQNYKNDESTRERLMAYFNKLKEL